MALGLLDRSNLYMLPTRHGLLFAILLTAMLLVAVNYSNSLAFLLTFQLVAVVLVSMLYTHRNLAGLEVSVGRCAPVFAGDAIEYELCMANHAARVRHDIGVEVNGEPGQRHNVASGQVLTIRCRAAARRRGWQSLPPVQINTRYPLGLMFSWSRRLQPDRKCLVYPAPGPLMPFPGDHGGVRYDPRSGPSRGDDFHGLREYREGDSLRQVDWKAYARGLGMMTKEFASGRSRRLVLRWEDTSGDIESRISCLTRWVIEADRLMLPYMLSLPGRDLPMDRGAAQRDRCLRELALF